MTTNEPPSYPGDSDPGDTPPPSGSGESPTSGLPSYGSVPPPEDTAPPPPPPPPPAPGGSAEGFSAPDAIGWGWRKFTENVGPILLAVLVFFVIEVVVSIIGGLVGGTSGFDMSSSSMDFDFVDLVVNLISTAITIVLSAGFARAALDVVDGRAFDFFGAFGRLNIVNVIVASVLVSILVTIGFILLVIPGVVALFLTYFTTLYVVDDDADSPVKAITDSVKLVSGRVGDSLLLALLNVLVAIAGVIALVVGLAVALPVISLASAYAYRRFREQPVAD